MAGPEISYEILDAVSSAITEAQCLGREGPYGGYDYGHNEAFYGKAPDDGRYVVRDFRKFGSPTWASGFIKPMTMTSTSKLIRA